MSTPLVSRSSVARCRGYPEHGADDVRARGVDADPRSCAAIQATTGVRSLPISPWAGLGVLAARGAAAVLAGGLLLWFRDA